MEKIIIKYFEFILQQLINDIQWYNNWWMLFIFPAVLYTCVLLLKFFVLLIPILLPLRLLVSIFYRNKTNNNTKNTISQKQQTKSISQKQQKDTVIDLSNYDENSTIK